MENLNLRGLATGLGSFPFTDPDPALDLVFKYCPQIPFWPQLPKRDNREGMVEQFIQGFPCLRVTGDGIYFEPKNQEDELEKFYSEIIAHNLRYFKIGPDFSAGLYEFLERLEKVDLKNTPFLKGQITGPFTTAASIKDEKGVALLHNPVFMQVIIKGLAMKALWQVKSLEKYAKKIIIFIDEPYLGCFGSAYTPLNREDVIRGLSEVSEAIKSDNVLVGVHCCGNTDWSMLASIPSIDIINFDAFAFQDKFLLYASDLGQFLKRGGAICWGIVPTQEFSGEETPQLLYKKIQEGIKGLAKKGVDEELAWENLLLAPACGLGSLDPLKAEKILRLLSETSALIR
ncbi:MAG: methionine synthase [Candidatus Omnitrophica bacterium]|jgi:methionine synthase II (cobalamin-independent)|nr:methionine synthase [Candidatus Omnitrophota bacterium]